MPSIVADRVSLNYAVFGIAAAGPKAQPGLAQKHAGALLPSSRRNQAFVQALQDVSFSLGPGDRLGLVGRNGSGKSTLLRVLAGVYEPSRGSVQVDGHVAPLFSVGLGVRKEATGRRNIILRGLMRGLTRREAEAKIPEIIEFSELGEFIDMPVRTYSSGMAMRLSFAMATAFSPEILLLDEWIGAGDRQFQEKARERMHGLVAGAGITVIASHRRGLIEEVCSKALWLDHGVARAFGRVDEVFEQMDAAENAK